MMNFEKLACSGCPHGAEKRKEICSLNGLVTSLYHSRSLFLEKDSSLFEEGEPADFVFALLSGAVKLCRRESATGEVFLSIIQPGRLFGLEALFPYGYYTSSAVLLKSSRVCKIPRERFQLVAQRCSTAPIILMDEVYRQMENPMLEKTLSDEQLVHFRVAA